MVTARPRKREVPVVLGLAGLPQLLSPLPPPHCQTSCIQSWRGEEMVSLYVPHDTLPGPIPPETWKCLASLGVQGRGGSQLKPMGLWTSCQVGRGGHRQCTSVKWLTLCLLPSLLRGPSGTGQAQVLLRGLLSQPSNVPGPWNSLSPQQELQEALCGQQATLPSRELAAGLTLLLTFLGTGLVAPVALVALSAAGR
jgi:hypothetical protein